MFGSRYRRPPFGDPINWTDYRWDGGAPRGGPAARRWSPRGPRRHSLLHLLFLGLAVIVGAGVLASLRSRRGPSGNGSWARKGFYAAVLVMVAAAMSRNRPRGSAWW